MINDDNFIVTKAWMSTRLGLSGTKLQVYGAIYAFTQDGVQRYKANINWLAAMINVCRRTIIRTINELVAEGLLIRYDVNKKTGGANEYTAVINPKIMARKEETEAEKEHESTTNTDGIGVTKCHTRGDKMSHPRGDKMSHPYIMNNINNNRNNIYKTHTESAREGRIFNNEAYAAFVERFNIITDNYSIAINDMDFDLLSKAFDESKNFLQSEERPQQRYLSWICKNYEKIIGGYYKDNPTEENNGFKQHEKPHKETGQERLMRMIKEAELEEINNDREDDD